MKTAKPSTLTYLIQQHLLRHAKPKSPLCLFRRSFSLLIRKPNQQCCFPSFFSPTSSSLPLQSPHISLSSLLVPKYLSSACEPEQDKDNVSLLPSHSVKNDEEEEDGSDRTLVSTREIRRSSEEVIAESSPMKLSVKEKKKLASYAHSLGDKLKCQLVGKSGVTDSVVFSVLETLEKNELLKVSTLWAICMQETISLSLCSMKHLSLNLKRYVWLLVPSIGENTQDMPWNARGHDSTFGGSYWFCSSRENWTDCNTLSS